MTDLKFPLVIDLERGHHADFPKTCIPEIAHDHIRNSARVWEPLDIREYDHYLVAQYREETRKKGMSFHDWFLKGICHADSNYYDAHGNLIGYFPNCFMTDNWRYEYDSSGLITKKQLGGCVFRLFEHQYLFDTITSTMYRVTWRVFNKNERILMDRCQIFRFDASGNVESGVECVGCSALRPYPDKVTTYSFRYDSRQRIREMTRKIWLRPGSETARELRSTAGGFCDSSATKYYYSKGLLDSIATSDHYEGRNNCISAVTRCNINGLPEKTTIFKDNLSGHRQDITYWYRR